MYVYDKLPFLMSDHIYMGYDLPEKIVSPFIIELTMSCEFFLGICGPISACVSVQSKQDLHCLPTESLETTECMNGEQSRMIIFAYRGWSRSVHFTRTQRHFLA